MQQNVVENKFIPQTFKLNGSPVFMVMYYVKAERLTASV